MGLLLFLLASGLTLIFGIMDFINLSHGSFYMIGAYFCGTIVAYTGSFALGIVIGLAGVFVVGALVEWFIARKLYREDHLDQVLVTFGLIHLSPWHSGPRLLSEFSGRRFRCLQSRPGGQGIRHGQTLCGSSR